MAIKFYSLKQIDMVLDQLKREGVEEITLDALKARLADTASGLTTHGAERQTRLHGVANCAGCGKFVSWENGHREFTPDTHFSAEKTEWHCDDCYKKRQRV